MTKILAKRRTETVVELDVEFPAYLVGSDYPDGGGETYWWYRFDENGMAYLVVSKGLRQLKHEWQYRSFEDRGHRILADLLHSTSTDYEKTTAEEFNKRVDEAIAALGEAKRAT